MVWHFCLSLRMHSHHHTHHTVLYVIILSAALDLVPPSTPKGIIAFCNIAPALLVKLGWPYLLKGRIRYARRIVSCCMLSFIGMLVRSHQTFSQTIISFSCRSLHSMKPCSRGCWEYVLRHFRRVSLHTIDVDMFLTRTRTYIRPGRNDFFAAFDNLQPTFSRRSERWVSIIYFLSLFHVNIIHQVLCLRYRSCRYCRSIRVVGTERPGYQYWCWHLGGNNIELWLKKSNLCRIIGSSIHSSSDVLFRPPSSSSIFAYACIIFCIIHAHSCRRLRDYN